MTLFTKTIFIALFMCPILVFAESNTKDTKLILHSDLYTAEFESRSAWTLHKLNFNGKPLLVPSGAMGTAINEEVAEGQNPYTGSRHGGEKVKSLKVLIDGKAVKLTGSKSQSVTGSIIEVKKTSTIGPLNHTSHITLSPAGLKQSYHFEVVGDTSKFKNMFLFMSVWQKSMDQWLAYTADKGLHKGKFKHNKTFINFGYTGWIALFDAETGIGGVCYYKLPKSSKSYFWDRIADNKHYTKYYPRKKQGFKFSCESFTKGFITNQKMFEQEAHNKAKDIKKELMK